MTHLTVTVSMISCHQHQGPIQSFHLHLVNHDNQQIQTQLQQRLRLNISQFCWEKVQVLLGVQRYWEISGFCAGKQPAIISNKNIKNKNWEIPSKKQTYQIWVDTSNIILIQRNRHISGFICRLCVPNINLVLFISSTMISMM
ncbi:Hypothetical_protein [Hexamita inflata]|uniref:Hypothetical_protein n=1 Tax=Hexamita inflata TaxID=28002 RepID=A0AA86UYE7_9EUKA|nr:Hypothetical protein HINF_LOCUS64710 [Hexamita inflata]